MFGSVQVFQVNQTGQVIQGANGQPIVVHSVPAGSQTIQIQNGQPLQQLQVVPVPVSTAHINDVLTLQALCMSGPKSLQ